MVKREGDENFGREKIKILKNGGWEEYQVVGNFIHPCSELVARDELREQGAGHPGPGRTEPEEQRTASPHHKEQKLSEFNCPLTVVKGTVHEFFKTLQ